MTRWDLFVWVWAPGLVLAAAASMTAAFRRGRTVVATIGAAATLAAVYVMVSSWTPDSGGFEELGLAATWLLIGVPLTVVTAIGALWPRRTTPAR